MAKETDTFNPFFGNVYTPQYTQEEQDLLRRVNSPPPSNLQDVEQMIKDKVGGLSDLAREFSQGQPRPLSGDEKEVVNESVSVMRKRAERIGKKISLIKNELEAEIDFEFKFKRRPRLKKAMRAVTGKNTNKVTYADYQMAMELKNNLQRSETNSFFEEEEDDDS